MLDQLFGQGQLKVKLMMMLSGERDGKLVYRSCIRREIASNPDGKSLRNTGSIAGSPNEDEASESGLCQDLFVFIELRWVESLDAT